MNKIFCLGELLLRMSPGSDWNNQTSMPVYLGGTELNVATALANWGTPVKYFTVLPDNYMAKEIIQALNFKKIDTSAIHLSGNRIGLYFIPQGVDLKNAGVIYDRAHSSFAALTPGVINWEGLLKDCGWFHFSAISPALNNNLAAVCKEALYYASGKKMMISMDLNYRASLWQQGRKPWNIMPELAKYCEVIMGNIWSAASLLGITVDPKLEKDVSKETYLEHASLTSRAILDKFPAAKTIANTFRFDDGGGIRYYATLDNRSGQFVSPEFSAARVVDKVGSGDCFMAGLIYGIESGHKEQQIIDFAAAAAFGKLQEKGDVTSQSVDAVLTLLQKP